MRLGPAACGALLLAALATGARAAEPPAVAVIVEQAQHPVLRSLRAELGAYGFRVLMVAPPAPQPGADALQAMALHEQALAAVWLLPATDGLDVWILDRVTGKTVLREIRIAASTEESWTDLAAVRVVELLRASLIELELPPPSGAARAPVPAPVLALVAEAEAGGLRLPGLGVGAAPAVTWGPGGVGVSVGLDVAVRAALGRRLVLSLTGFVPLARPEIVDAEGRATVGTFLARLSLDVLLADPDARALAFAGLGAGAVLLTMDGEALSPYVGRSDRIAAGLVHGHAGLRVRLSRVVSLTAEGGVGLVFPELAVRFARRDVATWGHPLLTGALGVIFGWD